MERTKFQKTIWNWYKENKRDFPWRRTHDPYKILVSEIMLQQTQTSRVRKKYPIFIKTFPSFQTLAGAPLKKVLKTWQGMGYNRRALYLRRIAQIVEKQLDGKLPSNPRDLEKLPGIGPYASRAVACFALEKCEPFLDTNIRRVFIHFFFRRKRRVQDAEILKIAEKMEPKRNLREWYLALMDYGANEFSSIKNPNRKSATWHTQSPFPGSKRYVRSLIIKRLLEKRTQSSEQIFRFISKRPKTNRFKTTQKLEPILKELQNENLVKVRENLWKIA